MTHEITHIIQLIPKKSVKQYGFTHDLGTVEPRVLGAYAHQGDWYSDKHNNHRWIPSYLIECIYNLNEGRELFPEYFL